MIEMTIKLNEIEIISYESNNVLHRRVKSELINDLEFCRYFGNMC